MLPLWLNCEPVFNVDKDLKKIRQAIKDSPCYTGRNVAVFPTSRAYIVTRRLKPIAIFDKLGPGFGGLLKLALAMCPDDIDNPDGYVDVELMNTLRKAVHSRGFQRPYTVAVFVGDRICFHFNIPVDLLLVICDRLRDRDIVSRNLWEELYDFGIDDPQLDTESDGLV